VKKRRRKDWKGKSSALYVQGGEEAPEPESERKPETHRKITKKKKKKNYKITERLQPDASPPLMGLSIGI
jgi:hypothetical protein